MSKLLIEEPPLQVLPSLALAIGLNEAIVLQQLHYLLRNPKFGKRIAQEQWIFNTYEQWRADYFPFWHQDTIKRVFSNLAKMGLVKTCQPEGRLSRRKYYAIDTVKLAVISEQCKLPSSNGANCTDGEGQIAPFLGTETTGTKTSKQRKAKGARGTSSGFQPRYDYPLDEEEMIETLQAHGVEYDPSYDGSFFDKMNENGWTIRGKEIFDWIETYRARLFVTQPGNF